MVLAACKILRDSVGFDHIAADERRLQFQDIIILADADITFNECGVDGVCAFRTTVDEFAKRTHDGREVGAEMVGQNGCHTRIDADIVPLGTQFPVHLVDIARYPTLYLIIAQTVALQPHALRVRLQFFPNSLPLVRFAVVADDKNRVRHRHIEIGTEGIPFLDSLRLTHHHHFLATHHGKTACGTDDRTYVCSLQVTAIHDLLVELTRHLVQCVLGDKLIHAIDIVRFLAAQHVDLRPIAGTQRTHNIFVFS